MSVYKITEPSVISFSGGRTSAYMLYRILDAHNGDLPDYAKVCFANTGKEMPQTLDFVRDCGEKWGVHIVWLERYAYKLPKEQQTKNKKFTYDLWEVDYATASRNGEPFLQLIKTRDYLPNPVARYCTKELKLNALTEYAEKIGFEKPYLGYVGIRYDEPTRWAKNHGLVECGQERYLPLYLDGITVKDVYQFWKKNDFDLQLYNNGGTTDWGNCDLCFLKAANKKQSIIIERPDLANWWVKAEALDNLVADGRCNQFRTDHPTIRAMTVRAENQAGLFDFDDETIPCFCGD